MLFAPANKPELVAKLPRSGPDAVVLDLEDAVAAGAKVGARRQARDGAAELLALPDAGPDAAPAVLVRVNSIRTEWFVGDIAEAVDPRVHAVVVPKIESLGDIATVATALREAGCGGVGIVAGIETVRGVADARELLGAEQLVACYFGAEDFTADLGGQRTDTNLEVVYARSHVAIAARLAGVAALDMVVTDFHDADRYTREASEARALGYAGKLCIHPSQVPLANAAFSPTAADVERARRLLDAFDQASAQGSAVIVFEGQMIDEPLAARARAVLEAHERGSS